MAVQVNLNTFENTEPQPQWLNQLKVTISMGKRFEQKGEMEKAVNCYETVLYYDPNDNRTRVRLSKCYQKLFQPEKAAIHQKYAMQNDPKLFQTIENEASVDFELGNLEQSLITYNKYNKQRKTSYDCRRGLLKANEVTNNIMPVESIMYCLRDTLLKMIENEQLLSRPMLCDTLQKPKMSYKSHKSNYKRSQETYYHRNIIEEVDFYRQQLNTLPKYNTNDILIYEQIKSVVQTFDKLKSDLYHQNPYYIFTCQQSKRDLKNRLKVKDMINLQISKYINTIVKFCLAGDICSAQRQAKLALRFMDEKWYRPKDIMNSLYEVFGLAIYLLNREIPKWSNELNEQRILFILGSKIEKNEAYGNVYQESYFGPHNYTNIKYAVKKLTEQIEESKLSTYNLYLQYELIKCYLKLNELKVMRPLTKQMFTDACKVGSIAWQTNALMMSVISESRLGNATICMETLEFIISLSRIMGNDNVTQFLRKIWKLFAEKQAHVPIEDPEGKIKSELVGVMADSEGSRYMRNLLQRNDNLPADCRVPLLLGESNDLNNCVIAGRRSRFPS